MPPATTRSRPPRAPLTGILWLGARLTLALRRTRRFLRWWLGIGGAATVMALLLPVATQAPASAAADTVRRAAADSTQTAERLRRAIARVAAADSLAASYTRASAAPPSPSAPPAQVMVGASLAAAVARAREGREQETVLALADHPAVAGGPRMRATADSLRRTRDTTVAFRLSGTILAMAEYRLRTMEVSAVLPTPPVPRAPSVRAPDTAVTNAIVRAERDTLAVAQQAHAMAREAALEAQRTFEAARTEVPMVSPGLAMLVLVLGGLVVPVAIALTREMQEPTLAHALEAERAVGAPALSLVRDALPDGPLRFRPGGVDPFRVLYLHLTSTGTRARAVLVTGDDAAVIAAVAARLAVAAAADHRTTLLAEWDTEQVALPRIFREYPEPGVSDVMAGGFSWREVARSVGASDGLSITMLPAGTMQARVSPERRTEALREFQHFRERFEFSIVAVSLADMPHGRALMPDALVVLVASVGVTPVQVLERNASIVETDDAPLHSLVLWDAPRPVLPSRTELAAWLSKRRGRGPGASFDASKKPPTRQ
jgi:Mrp family chromosome partitioning ATPase